MNSFVTEALAAEQRIRSHIRCTSLDYSPFFSQQSEAKVYFKTENLQYTGSFKVRGALNKILSLSAAERSRGVVTASSGNHGAAVAFALQKIQATGIVFVPNDASSAKIAAIKQLRAIVQQHGDDCIQTETVARQYAKEQGLAYIPPYNDPQVIAGQGTIAIELLKQLSNIDAVFVSLGGGGLISGIAAYLKQHSPNTRIIGCSPENSKVMIESVKAGKILDLPSLPTLSDGTAGGVEAETITLPLVSEWVDEFVTVSEQEIKESLGQFIDNQHQLIEGAAATALAAFSKTQSAYRNQNVAIVLCGANISSDTLRIALAK